MSIEAKILKIGHSAGVVLPNDVLERLNVTVGDSLNVLTTPGGVELRPHNADFVNQMAAARDVIVRRRQAMRELVK